MKGANAMTLEKIKTASLVDLMICVDKADNKAEVNSIIFELACRTYIPFSGVSFDDLLLSYGYVKPEKKEKEKVKSKTLFK